MTKQTSTEFLKATDGKGASDADPFAKAGNEDMTPEEKARLKDQEKNAFGNKQKPQNEEEISSDERAMEYGNDSKQNDSKQEEPPVERWDEKIIAENRKKFPRQIEKLEAYREAMMNTYGVNMALPLDIPFRAGKDFNENDLHPSVFIGKLVGKVEIVKPKDASEQPIIVTQYENIRIGYQETKADDKNTATLMATNFITDHNLKGKNENDTKCAIVEIVKTAFILAENAKAAGWTEVNFGRTTDPVKRYAMLQACKYVGLVCPSEIVDANDLPKTMFMEAKIETLIAAHADRIAEKIYTPIEKQGTPPVQNPGTKAPNPEPQPMAA